MSGKKRTSPITPSQVRDLRGELSQTAVSHLCGICVRTWKYYEAGEIAMSQAVFDYCYAIINLYHTTASVL